MTNLNEIIEACKRGEEIARKLLYEQFSQEMRAICFRYIGSYNDTEDVLQESFIKVFTKLDQYNGKGSFEGWLKMICINASLNFLKKKSRSRLSHGDEELAKWENENLVVPLSDKLLDAEEVIGRLNLSKDEIIELLQELPAGYKTVFNLYVFEKHSHKEIAELLMISVNTSKSQLKKARKYLKQILYKKGLEQLRMEDHEQYRSILKVVV